MNRAIVGGGLRGVVPPGQHSRAQITGVGETDYVRGTTQTTETLLLQAALAACEDAGVEPASVDGVVMPSGKLSAEAFVHALGIADLRFHAANSMGGASAAAAIMIATAAVISGQASRVVVAAGGTQYSGGRKLSRADGSAAQFSWPAQDFRTHLERPYGLTVPMQWYSLQANRWLHETGADPAGLREVALAARAHARNNTRAYFRDRPLTAEQYDSAPYVVTPFRLYDICLESDGAAAVIVEPATAAAHGSRRGVLLLGGGEGHADVPDDLVSRPDILELGLAKAARRVLGGLGLSAADFDFAQIYDCFTFVVLRQLEELGFCKRGEGSDYVLNAGIGPGSSTPVNTHGGLLAQAHIAGMNHVVEAVRQLRGDAGAAQLARAELGLVTNYGDLSAGSLLVLAAS
jgi:acetyl-CoA acetyltransferase